MPLLWEQYLGSPAESYGDCRRRCSGAFDAERQAMRQVLEYLRPRTVVCLGAGVLNDIPYAAMVRSGAAIHLVDWLPGSAERGVEHSIITSNTEGRMECVFCSPGLECPEESCTNYRTPSDPASTTCSAFVPVPGDDLLCASFHMGTRTSVHYEDVTAGYASHFARAAVADINRVRSWRQALGKAQAAVERVKRFRVPLTIPSGYAQLVTSSMLISQFEHEPYQYFSEQAAQILGPPGQSESAALQSVTENLRSALLVNQVERHCEEIRRILAPGGVCYMSFELFHRHSSEATWFLVKSMYEALGVLGRHFHFNFDILTDRDTLTRFEVGGEPSLTFRFLLEPIA